MDKKDLYDLEDQIISIFNNTIKSIDLANLKIDINDKTQDISNEFKSKFNEYGSKYINLNKKSSKDVSAYITKKPAGSVSGVLYMVFGIGGSVVYLLSMIGITVIKSIFGSIPFISGEFLYGTALVLLSLSLALLFRGIYLRKRVKRFRKYVRFIDNNTYILIDDLSKFMKEKNSFVIKDLTKMTDLGMFLEGHIDEEKTYFILNDDVYSDYLTLKRQQESKELTNEELKDESYDSEKEKIESTIKIGRQYIEQIKDIKNELHREDIFVKLDKLVNISNQIINQVEKNPKKINEVNRFINHYLPMTMKLINSYKEISTQSLQGENIQNAKIEIENSIELINSAFERLLDDLFEDIALDISTDISVLKTLFKQEGLTEEDFKN